MGFHTFDPAMADRLEDESRFRFCSREELLGGLGVGDSVDNDESDTDDVGGGNSVDDETTAHLVDLGSGTGFYTRELAPFFTHISAVDIQSEMHDLFGEHGVPDTVDRIECSTDDLPLDDDSATAAVSTMTAHELPLATTLSELQRVLVDRAPVVVVDWSTTGRGEAGPPLAERHDAATVADAFLDAEFTVDTATERSETFVIHARR